jgi:hypothetical protein
MEDEFKFNYELKMMIFYSYANKFSILFLNIFYF